MEGATIDEQPLDVETFYEAISKLQRVGVVQDDDLRNQWVALTMATKHEILDLVAKLVTAEKQFDRHSAVHEKINGNFPGHTFDDDVYGQEKARYTFKDVANNKRDLAESIRTCIAAGDALGLVAPPVLKALLRPHRDFLDVQLATLGDLERWLTEKEAAAKKRITERNRIGTSALGRGWVGYWELGEGAFGTARLYVRQDAAGRIVDRIVIKDSYRWSPGGKDRWTPDSVWTDGRPDVPVEIQALYNLRGKVGSTSIVKIRNWRMGPNSSFHRQYLEFCPFQTLCDVKDRYALVCDLETSARDPDSLVVPEAFLWHCFERLAMAGMLMERGELEPGGIGQWKPIIHLDIKLDNVFLGINNEGDYLGTPAAKLGDFGLARILSESIKGPVGGTPAYMAPEQRSGKFVYLPNDPCVARVGMQPDLNSKTDVYCVGLVLWSLANLEEGLPTPPDGIDDLYETVEGFDDAALNSYSRGLQNLILKCVSVWPDDRPTFDQIMKKVRKAARKRRLNDAGESAPSFDDLLIDMKTADRWAIGAVLEVSGDDSYPNINDGEQYSPSTMPDRPQDGEISDDDLDSDDQDSSDDDETAINLPGGPTGTMLPERRPSPEPLRLPARTAANTPWNQRGSTGQRRQRQLRSSGQQSVSPGADDGDHQADEDGDAEDNGNDGRPRKRRRHAQGASESESSEQTNSSNSPPGAPTTVPNALVYPLSAPSLNPALVAHMYGQQPPRHPGFHQYPPQNADAQPQAPLGAYPHAHGYYPPLPPPFAVQNVDQLPALQLDLADNPAFAGLQDIPGFMGVGAAVIPAQAQDNLHFHQQQQHVQAPPNMPVQQLDDNVQQQDHREKQAQHEQRHPQASSNVPAQPPDISPVPLAPQGQTPAPAPALPPPVALPPAPAANAPTAGMPNICGAPTQKGTRCRVRVRNGGRCHHHRTG